MRGVYSFFEVTPMVTPRTGFAMLLETGARDAEKGHKKETGVYEKEPGSGVWWVRFKSNKVTRREKIGRRGDAIATYKG
jgi:hypothetical protein